MRTKSLIRGRCYNLYLLRLSYVDVEDIAAYCKLLLWRTEKRGVFIECSSFLPWCPKGYE